MSNIEQPEQAETMDIATAQRVEQEKMTRRAALRKLGFGAGMAAFALLGVDDFARMVGNRMERVAGDNKVVEQVAKEFQAMGLASADPGYPYYSQSDPACVACGNKKTQEYTDARIVFGHCNDNCPTNPTQAVPDPCGCLCQYAKSNRDACVESQGCCATNGCNCGPSYPCPPLPAGCT